MATDGHFRSPGPAGDFKFTESVPARLRIPGYSTYSASPNGASQVMLVPDSADVPFAVTCGKAPRDVEFLLCVVVSSYPPDPKIFLQARVYFPKPFEAFYPRFAPIAARMLEIATCLDVTDGDRPRAPDGSRVLVGCRDRPGS
jgi:hypothetical protein